MLGQADQSPCPVRKLQGNPGCLVAGFWVSSFWTSRARTLSTRPHLNIKCLTELRDQCTQSAVSHLPASRLQNASLLSPRAAEAFVRGFLGRPALKRKCSYAEHQPWKPQPGSSLWSGLPLQKGSCVWPFKPQKATTSFQLKKITENEERSLRRGAQMIQSLEMRPCKKAWEHFLEKRLPRRLGILQARVQLSDQISLLQIQLQLKSLSSSSSRRLLT